MSLLTVLKVKRIYDTEQMKVVQRAFNEVPFKQSSDLSKYFLDFITKCAQSWDPRKYYAPYFSLVQASGTGKTKLLKVIADEVYVVYCCLRDENSSGYPPKSTIATYLLQESDDDYEGKYVAFLSACIDKLNDSNVKPAVWFSYQIDAKKQIEFWKDIKLRMSVYLEKFRIKVSSITKVYK